MSSTPPAPVIVLRLDNAARLEHLTKWAAIAEAIGISPSSAVSLDYYKGIEVRSYLSPIPHPADYSGTERQRALAAFDEEPDLDTDTGSAV